MSANLTSRFGWIFLLWLLLVVVVIVTHSFIPIDETRYVTVAWNMWLSGDWLVPHLNGAAYSDKPPMLFWLMNAGWYVFGVNEWWPSLMSALFALANLWLTARLALKLWPEQRALAADAMLILFGAVLWALFTAATMFDMLVTFFTLLGLHGLLLAWRGKRLVGWLLFGLAIGGGLLAKGPVIFLQLLPVALLAPWWCVEKRSWAAWYAALCAACLCGLVLALAWAIPAGMRGGETYQNAIFWGQTAHRMVESFAHKRAWWWYIMLAPALFFPWIFWRPFWSGMRRLPGIMSEPGVRFVIAWFVPVFAGFSLISGKQIHYLLPIYPAFALFLARIFPLAGNGKKDHVPALLVTLFLALLLLYLPGHVQQHELPMWVEHLPAWGAGVLALGAVLLWLAAARRRLSDLWSLALISVLISALCHGYLIHSAGGAYDVRAMSARVKQLQDAAIPVANFGAYPGTYNFLGRLTHSPDVLGRATVQPWLEQHPEGRVLIYPDQQNPITPDEAEFVQFYRTGQAAIVNRQQFERICIEQRYRCE
ncbi:MAG: glycosyltransferase family 39 protein [Methylobacillus sp.]|nr:glycosyltransferase family 39 protein [Methylobacillus sp.]